MSLGLSELRLPPDCAYAASMQSFSMHKCLSVTLLFIGAALPGAAQFPQQTCTSNPFMDGCPAAEENRKNQELMSHKWWEEHPELLNPKLPGAKQLTPTAKPVAADNDWRRPRLAQPLPANWPRWTFAQPDAGALVGMKLKALGQSPVLAELLGSDLSRHWQASVPQVDEVWVSIRPLPGGKTEAVMLFSGAVDSVAADLWSKGVTVCYLDKKTLLAGEWNAVNRALARVIAAAPNSFSKRAGELWPANDLWMIAGGRMINQILPPTTDTAGLTGVSVGMSLQSRVSIDMLLTAAPAETARLAAKFAKDPEELALGPVTVEKTLRGVSVRAALDPSQLPDALKQQITDQIRPLMNLAGAPPAGATPSNDGAIVIQGLDDGPRTIPVQKQR
jgi:hypothetical protein